MQFLNSLKGRINALIKPDKAVDAFVSGLIHHSDPAAFDYLSEHKLKGDTPLRNGETVLTHTLKTAKLKHYAHMADCERCDTATSAIQQTIDAIEDKKTACKAKAGSWQNNAKLKACVHFSHAGFLQTLGVPKENWPDALLDSRLYEDFNQAFAPVAKSRDQAHESQSLVKALCPGEEALAQAAPNTDGITPEFLYLSYRKAQAPGNLPDADDAKARVEGARQRLTSYTDVLEKRLSGQEFIAAAKDDALKASFPWLAAYKPDETQFMAAFDTDRETRLSAMLNLRYDQVRAGNNPKPGSKPYSDDMEPTLEKTPKSRPELGESSKAWQKREREEREARDLQRKKDHDAQQQRLIDQLERDRLLALRNMGFYEWQPERYAAVTDVFKQVEQEQKKELALHAERISRAISPAMTRYLESNRDLTEEERHIRKDRNLDHGLER